MMMAYKRHKNFPDYKIYRSGKVYSERRKTYLKYETTKNGYNRVTLCNKGTQKRFLLHRLICECFLKSFDKTLQVNHKDGDKSNNELSNLEMVTGSQNMIHAYKNKLQAPTIGKLNGMCKLDDSDIIKIHQLANSGDYKQKDIAKMFGIARQYVSDIKLEKYRKYLFDKKGSRG